MPKYTVPFNRLVNNKNDIKFFKHLLPQDLKTIIEPFCGTCAVSRICFPDSDIYEYHFNDLDEEVYFIMNNLKEYVRRKNEVVEEYINDYKSKGIQSKEYIKIMKERTSSIDKYLLKFNIVWGYIFKLSKTRINPNDYLIFEKATKTNKDYKEIMEKYKDDEKAFIFLDPPYLFSNNSAYNPQEDESDMTEIIIYTLDYLKTCKCKVMLIINKLYILEFLFNDYIEGEYDKKYQLGKKKSKHLIITNYSL